MRLRPLSSRISGLALWAGWGLIVPASQAAGTQLSVPSQALAPIVIYDAGGVSLGDVMQDVVPDARRRPLPQAQSQIAPRLQPGSFRIFPVRTIGAAPGFLTPSQRAPLPHGPGVPICIIGDDELSRQWLRINLGLLRAQQIACVVASVATEGDFKRLEFEAPGIRMVPSSIDALAKTLGIDRWPVLIAPDGRISQ